jgi:hypothetical protein
VVGVVGRSRSGSLLLVEHKRRVRGRVVVVGGVVPANVGRGRGRNLKF